MDIKKELEQKLLNKEMTLLEMDNAVLDILELEEESYPRDKNSLFAHFDPVGIIKSGNFVYAGSESFFDVFFEATENEKADTFDTTVQVTYINNL